MGRWDRSSRLGLGILLAAVPLCCGCQARLLAAPSEGAIDTALVASRAPGSLLDLPSDGEAGRLKRYPVARAALPPGRFFQIGGPGDGDAGSSLSADVTAPPTAAVQGQGSHGIPGTHTSRTGRLFPLLGRKVEARGHELPYPIGLGAGYFFTERGMEITRLDVSLGGTPIDVSKVLVEPLSRASAWEVKADLWILPFLNAYAFYGKISTNTVTTVTIPNPVPGPGPSEFTFDLPTKLDGDTFGGGIVLAGGYKSWFVSINSNYSRTDLGFDDLIEANVNSFRIGRHKKMNKFELAGWIGGTYWNLEKSVAGTIEVPGLGDIAFDVQYKPVEPMNLIVGSHVVYDKRFELVFEYGFWEDVTTLSVHGGFRL